MKTKEIIEKTFAVSMVIICLMVIGFFALMIAHQYYNIQYEKVDIQNNKLQTDILKVEKQSSELRLRKLQLE